MYSASASHSSANASVSGTASTPNDDSNGSVCRQCRFASFDSHIGGFPRPAAGVGTSAGIARLPGFPVSCLIAIGVGGRPAISRSVSLCNVA